MKGMEGNLLCGKLEVCLTKDKDTAIPRCSFSVETLVTVSDYSCVDLPMLKVLCKGREGKNV